MKRYSGNAGREQSRFLNSLRQKVRINRLAIPDPDGQQTAVPR